MPNGLGSALQISIFAGKRLCYMENQQPRKLKSVGLTPFATLNGKGVSQ